MRGEKTMVIDFRVRPLLPESFIEIPALQNYRQFYGRSSVLKKRILTGDGRLRWKKWKGPE